MILDPQQRAEFWASLPEGIRQQVDGYVLQDGALSAVRVLIDVGFVRFGIGVASAHLLVGDRYRELGDRVARTPDGPVDPESLAWRAAGIDDRILAVEAVWDGDTVHDWFVALVAIGEGKEHHLATLYRGTAERYLGSDDRVDGRPHTAVAADRIGRALAERLGVPFHFASPDEPDDEAPRWVRPTPGTS
ncbi:hypothetical protein [Streptomyces sp. TLI_171]|uniref:hypothetical protein n=1 Tax=Streptomyces sp. TLI_171 TaxID=1938859 RepID=UPI00217D239A|nr:hypothetical protein [Streptomyces sp. TLI_171]